MGQCIIPAIGAGAGLLGNLLGGQGRPMEYRETPFQRQMGDWLMGQIQRGQPTMSPELFGQFQQAYAMPQSASWAAGLLPQMFGGMGFPQMGGAPGQAGGFPQAGGMGFPQMTGGMGFPGGFGMPGQFNPFAMMMR